MGSQRKLAFMASFCHIIRECRKFGHEGARGHRTPCSQPLGLSYENKSQVGKIALAISAFRSEVPDLCRSPIRSEGRQASLHSIIRLAGVPPR